MKIKIKGAAQQNSFGYKLMATYESEEPIKVERSRENGMMPDVTIIHKGDEVWLSNAPFTTSDIGKEFSVNGLFSFFALNTSKGIVLTVTKVIN